MSKITNSLQGKLLLSMPGMGDPRFYKSAILVCTHDRNGAMGLVINQAVLNLSLRQLLAHLKLTSCDTVRLDTPVLLGGPVEPARGFMLHTPDFSLSDTLTISHEISLSITLDALKTVAKGEGPEDFLFILGYSGWSPGQLEQEIQDNSWMIGEADRNLIFGTPLDQKWQRGMNRIGIDPALLSNEAGQA